MCGVFTSVGLVPSLMMLTALLAPTAGDQVTLQVCSDYGSEGRVRRYPQDLNATDMNYSNCGLPVDNDTDILGLPNLTKIDLDYNPFTQIDLAVFRHVPKLEYLTLSYNKLRELPAFPKNSCPNLTRLDVAHNELKEFNDPNTFSACAKLKVLYLAYNQITYIHPDLFSSLNELSTLKLHENHLTFIPDQMITRNLKLRDLWLMHNKLTYLPQDFLSNIKNAGGGLKVFYFYGNPLQCACVLELLADVMRAGVEIQMFSFFNDYSGEHKNCPFVRAPCDRPLSGRLLPPA